MKLLKRLYYILKSSKLKKLINILIISLIITTILMIFIMEFIIKDSYKKFNYNIHINEIFLGFIFIFIKCLVRTLVEKYYDNILNILKIVINLFKR